MWQHILIGLSKKLQAVELQGTVEASLFLVTASFYSNSVQPLHFFLSCTTTYK